MTGSIKIKIIMEDGIVTDVLSDDTRLPIDVEIVDICKDYEDYDDLVRYRDELYYDASYEFLRNVSYADFK